MKSRRMVPPRVLATQQRALFRSNYFDLTLSPHGLPAYPGVSGRPQVRNELAEIAFVLCFAEKPAHRMRLSRAGAMPFRCDLVDVAARHGDGVRPPTHLAKID